MIVLKIVLGGLAAGFLSNAVIGFVMTRKQIHALLTSPTRNSATYVDVTAKINLPVAISGLVALSVIHAWDFTVLSPSLPGDTWAIHGLAFGGLIWLFFWLFQEWFSFRNLLKVPLAISALRLCVLAGGAAIE